MACSVARAWPDQRPDGLAVAVPSAAARACGPRARQAPQLGTGHAVQQALPHLTDGDMALVLYGDVPLIGVPTLRRLVAAAGNERLALLTVKMDNPTGYGRILRNAAGAVTRIVEEKDATDAERKVQEVNTGILVAPVARLGARRQRRGIEPALNRRYTQQGREPQGRRAEIIQQQPKQPGRESLGSARRRSNEALALPIASRPE